MLTGFEITPVLNVLLFCVLCCGAKCYFSFFVVVMFEIICLNFPLPDYFTYDVKTFGTLGPHKDLLIIVKSETHEVIFLLLWLLIFLQWAARCTGGKLPP